MELFTVVVRNVTDKLKKLKKKHKRGTVNLRSSGLDPYFGCCGAMAGVSDRTSEHAS
jgi:hypothetical protein